MADEAEPEEDWDPEKEKKDENLQREYLKLGRELLQDLKAEKEKKERADAEAKENLLALQARILAAPRMQAVVGAYHVPTYEEVVKRLEVCWAETKRIVGDAPPEVQTAVFHTLMQACAAESAAPVAEGPADVPLGP